MPVPDSEYFKSERTIEVGIITETKDGGSRLPAWLSAYLSGGIEAVERIERYSGKYMFVGNSEGLNFTAMEKWTENYSPVRDFAILAASRIEKRMIANISFYPDDEYGPFFENMIKKAYSAVYPGVVKEDSYWIKTVKNEGGEPEENGAYIFFVLVSIDKMTMQTVITNMITESIVPVTPAGPVSSVVMAQRGAVNRLRQNFFEGF
jgi:hypothetical protein